MKNKIILFITFLIISLLFSCGEDRTNRDSSKYFNKICVEGHVYYDGGNQLAIKLNDDGTPVKCEGK